MPELQCTCTGRDPCSLCLAQLSVDIALSEYDQRHWTYIRSPE